MCSLVMSLSCDVISRLTGLTCSKAPGFWMVEHQIVSAGVFCSAYYLVYATIAK